MQKVILKTAIYAIKISAPSLATILVNRRPLIRLLATNPPKSLKNPPESQKSTAYAPLTRQKQAENAYNYVLLAQKNHKNQ
jgi:hypothetical protein